MVVMIAWMVLLAGIGWARGALNRLPVMFMHPMSSPLERPLSIKHTKSHMASGGGLLAKGTKAFGYVVTDDSVVRDGDERQTSGRVDQQARRVPGVYGHAGHGRVQADAQRHRQGRMPCQDRDAAPRLQAVVDVDGVQVEAQGGTGVVGERVQDHAPEGATVDGKLQASDP